MARWADVEAEAPELARKARARFEVFGSGALGTVRADGSPRVSMVDQVFADGDLWFGSMPGSRKTADLERDDRIALHCVSPDKNVPEGDAKLMGRALRVTDDAEFERYFVGVYGPDHGHKPDFPLFRVDVRELSHLMPAGDHLVIEIWREGRGVESIDRY